MRKILLRSASALVLLLLILLGAVGWIGSERALHPAYRSYEWNLSTFADLRPERVLIRTSDHIVLEGRFFPGARRSLVILACGYGDTQDQMLSIAEFLHHAGFAILTYNPRARLPSGGAEVTLGVLEQLDLVQVVDAAVARPDVDPAQIAVLGISMGGATAILSAARDKRIHAVVDDSGFSDAPRVIAASFEHFIHLPAFPFAPVTVAIASLRAGVNVNDSRPMDVIRTISPRPILIIHEQGDRVVPPDNSRRNFEAAGQPKTLWIASGARHGRAHTDHPEEYQKRVVAFLDAAFQ